MSAPGKGFISIPDAIRELHESRGWSVEDTAKALLDIDADRLTPYFISQEDGTVQPADGYIEVGTDAYVTITKALQGWVDGKGQSIGHTRAYAKFGWKREELMKLLALKSIVGAGGAVATGTLTDARIAAIEATARRLKYDPLSVPYGGKAEIERQCLETMKGKPHVFTADTFKKAWQAARDAGLIDVENVEIYRGQ